MRIHWPSIFFDKTAHRTRYANAPEYYRLLTTRDLLRLKAAIADIELAWELSDNQFRLLVVSWVGLIVIPSLGVLFFDWSTSSIVSFILIDLLGTALAEGLLMVLARERVEDQADAIMKARFADTTIAALVGRTASEKVVVSTAADALSNATKVKLRAIAVSVPVAIGAAWMLAFVQHDRYFYTVGALMLALHLGQSLMKAKRARRGGPSAEVVVPQMPAHLVLAGTIGVVFLGMVIAVDKLTPIRLRDLDVSWLYLISLAATAGLIYTRNRRRRRTRRKNLRRFREFSLGHWIRSIGEDPGKVGLD